MRRILDEAVAAGNATARTIALRPRIEEGFHYYADSATWFNRCSAAATSSRRRRR
jgi:hypothetical protein